ncbi:MAG: glycosyltransferase [Armatimonadetes bacterium]|nr:glycosyltransferase [Armatimonadota bacterium]
MKRMDPEVVSSSVCTLRTGDHFRQELDDAGISVTCLAATPICLPLVPIHLAFRLRAERADLLHTHLEGSKIVGVCAARIAGRTRVICHEANIVDKLPRWLQAPFVRRADLLIGVSESAIRAAKASYGIPDQRLATIPNALDLDEIDAVASVSNAAELPIPDDARIVMFVGRLTIAKGLEYLLTAATAVVRHCPTAHFVIVGDGPLRDALEKRACDLGLSSHVCFIGRRQDVLGLLQKCDIYVQPSIWEGFPNAVLEAMAMGRPVVATDVGGVPELVRNGETGLLVPAADPELLANAINQLLDNEALARSMGAAGRLRVRESFSIEQMALRLECLYRQVMNTNEMR